jgi:hypothetical protein
MTNLKLLILTAILRHGQQSVMALWEQTTHQPLTVIVMAVAELEHDGFLEEAPRSPNPFPARVVGHDLITYWRLTEKGRQSVAAQKEQEVLS